MEGWGDEWDWGTWCEIHKESIKSLKKKEWIEGKHNPIEPQSPGVFLLCLQPVCENLQGRVLSAQDM